MGLSIASRFKGEGCKVADVSRTIKDDLKNTAHKVIACSVTPEEVTRAFEEVEKDLGIPNVVVYNGMTYLLSIVAVLVQDITFD